MTSITSVCRSDTCALRKLKTDVSMSSFLRRKILYTVTAKMRMQIRNRIKMIISSTDNNAMAATNFFTLDVNPIAIVLVLYDQLKKHANGHDIFSTTIVNYPL